MDYISFRFSFLSAIPTYTFFCVIRRKKTVEIASRLFNARNRVIHIARLGLSVLNKFIFPLLSYPFQSLMAPCFDKTWVATGSCPYASR